MKGYIVVRKVIIREFGSVDEAESYLDEIDFFYGKLWVKEENKFVPCHEMIVLSEHDAVNFIKE